MMATDDNPREDILYPTDEFLFEAHISSLDEYRKLYVKSIEDPEAFWMDIANEFYWKRSPNKPLVSYNFDASKGPIRVKWLDSALTNMCYNVLDRVVDKGLGDRVAYYWESNDDNSHRIVTYNGLLRDVCRFANALKSLGVKKGDRVAVYMSVSIELVVVMLSCARIGAIHTVIFAGFSAPALADRIMDANCILLVTADGAYRANKFIPLKSIADSALEICKRMNHKVIATIVSPHLKLYTAHGMDNNATINYDPKVDILWNDIMKNVSDSCEPEWMEAEDTLFILYTSGSTGKPKGIVHTIGGYLLYAYITFKYVFNYTDGDV
ncbi:unnamed protein product, partial [Oppiella nova]